MFLLNKSEDNFVFVVQQIIKYYELSITNNSVIEFIKSHPDYPSVKTICDAFKEWKIIHYPLRLRIDQLKSITSPFLVYINSNKGELAILYKIHENEVVLMNSEVGKKSIPIDIFLKIWDGVVVLIEPNKEESGEYNYKLKKQQKYFYKTILPLTLIALITIFIVKSVWEIDLRNLNWIWWIVLSTSFLGIILSYMLVLIEFGSLNKFTEKICKIGRNNNNCEKIVADKNSKLFSWISWGDVGIIYFTANILFMVGLANYHTLHLLSILSLCSLSYTFFSIYYQAFVFKKWCPLCLAVQAVLLIQFALLIIYIYQFNFEFITIISYLQYIFIISIGWLIFKGWVQSSINEKEIKIKYLKNKRNPKVFKIMLENALYIDNLSNLNGEILLGNFKAPITVITFLSLQCAPCKKVWSEIKQLLDSKEIKIHLFFLVTENKNFKKIIELLYLYHLKNEQDKIIEVLDNWYLYKKFDKKGLNLENLDLNIIEEKIERSKEIYLKLKINHTPSIFIQNYTLPEQYTLKEILWFKDILIQKSLDKDTVRVALTN